MKIWIGCDHAGYDLKKEVIAYLEQHAIAYEDLGCDGSRVDYPDIAKAVCTAVVANQDAKGIWWKPS